ncbi:MAG: hypothetical protein U0103_06340 [Candidatus Obscuribacterales bacterium]
MDINPFEIAGKTVRRTHETLLDAYCYTEENFCHTFPVNAVFGRLEWARDNSAAIMNAAHTALMHNDVEEAEHQFRRELYFTGLFDKFAGSPDEVAARAGLNAIDNHQSANSIDLAIREAWSKRLYDPSY